MMRTEEQLAANTLMEEAIRATVEAYGLCPPGAVLLDYVTILEMRDYDENGDPESEYIGMSFRHGEARKSVALGLFEQGKHLLLSGERVE